MAVSSIIEVAQHAGVSIATVSRVVNNSSHPISQEIREKVEKAVKELNYIPNRSAQVLRQNKRNEIALLVRNISDPYFSEISKGVTETGIKRGVITAIFSSMQDPELELRYYELILKQQYDAVIIAGGAYTNSESQKELKKIVRLMNLQGSKVVALAPQGFELPNISIDNIEVGYKATNFLISKGHKEIAFLGGYAKHLADEQRFDGYVKALDHSGIIFSETLKFQSSYSIAGGYYDCEQLVNSRQKFSAIFCSNDHIARGAMMYLKDHGIDVPEQVSVIGVGGFFISNYYMDDIGLTTIKFPLYEIGGKAVNYILAEKYDINHKEILDTVLVEKTTVRAV